MLGALILGAAGGGGDAVQGAIAIAQGTAAQQQVNFTRSNEYESLIRITKAISTIRDPEEIVLITVEGVHQCPKG